MVETRDKLINPETVKEDIVAVRFVTYPKENEPFSVTPISFLRLSDLAKSYRRISSEINDLIKRGESEEEITLLETAQRLRSFGYDARDVSYFARKNRIVKGNPNLKEPPQVLIIESLTKWQEKLKKLAGEYGGLSGSMTDIPSEFFIDNTQNSEFWSTVPEGLHVFPLAIRNIHSIGGGKRLIELVYSGKTMFLRIQNQNKLDENGVPKIVIIPANEEDLTSGEIFEPYKKPEKPESASPSLS